MYGTDEINHIEEFNQLHYMGNGDIFLDYLKNLNGAIQEQINK